MKPVCQVEWVVNGQEHYCGLVQGHAGFHYDMRWDEKFPNTTLPAGLPTDPKARKAIPIFSGFIAYFPLAIAAVAELSRIGNDQHNPGKPLHWDRTKSQDELDALTRHLVDDAMGVPTDTDGVLHATKVAWRAMANLEKLLETQHDISPRA